MKQNKQNKCSCHITQQANTNVQARRIVRNNLFLNRNSQASNPLIL